MSKKEIKIILELTPNASKELTECLLKINEKIQERKQVKQAS